MLGRILATVRAAGQPMCLADLSRDLGIDESALEGMLDTLVARGRLRAISLEGAACGGCPLRSGCYILDVAVARIYALPNGPASVVRTAQASARESSPLSG